ncbi:MAG: hypothetical protein JWL62_267 [Hyphomicrobiales bacterium]|nr:hypothetical protein [Hyphomicrobiales bacterium]
MTSCELCSNQNRQPYDFCVIDMRDATLTREIFPSLTESMNVGQLQGSKSEVRN